MKDRVWALGNAESMNDNELFEAIKGHPGVCGCEGCREYEERLLTEGIR